jgi:hypothetical protein
MSVRFPAERHLYRLVGGALVHSGAIWALDSLLATGHRVELTDDGLSVEPTEDLTDGQGWSLETFEEDLVILLRAGPSTIH